jgi:H+/gluconate symporter-like permease
MSRIFSVLATVTALALLATFGLGLVQLGQPAAASLSLSLSSHIILGLISGIVVLLVHCLVFTYFLGTGRWIREVAEAYAIAPAESTEPARRLKRRAYPPAMVAMLVTIATVGSGAASHTDPTSVIGYTHPILAVLTLLANGWAFYRQWHAIRDNQVLLDRVMSLVEQIRSK